MPKIAIHIHLYYYKMWEQIKQLLNNIQGYEYDLFVTVVNENASVLADIKATFPNVKIFEVENRGYDVGPFCYFLSQIKLSDYAYILKIHTKDDKAGSDTYINHNFISRKAWRHLLQSSLIGSSKIFANNIQALENNPKIGMIGSKYLITSTPKTYMHVKEQVLQTMERLGYAEFKQIKFVAGTMFLVRSELLKDIQDNFKISDFAPTDGNVKDGTLAHVLERVFGCLVVANGYLIKGIYCDRKYEICSFGLRVCNFIYRKKITKNNYLQIKIFKLPIYRKKLI